MTAQNLEAGGEQVMVPGPAARRTQEPARATRTSRAQRSVPGANIPDLRKDLRDFASARPQGWDHNDWLQFLEALQERGHNINDRDLIGMALEKERLDLALSGVKGVGPRRRAALVERYGNLWSLRNANPEEIAAVAGVKRDLAEEILAAAG